MTCSAASSRAAGVAEQVSGRAWLQALLDFEAALARAQARAGEITHEQADAIVALCDADRYDVAEIGAGAAEIGNPAGAVVKALKAADRRARAQGRDQPGRGRHRGDARHQARARAAAGRPARGAPTSPRGSPRTHRDTPIIGRTLLQQANPTTFGLKAAGWALGLDDAADTLHSARLAYQLGGPVGHARPVLPARSRPRRAGDPLAHAAQPDRRARRRPRRRRGRAAARPRST